MDKRLVSAAVLIAIGAVASPLPAQTVAKSVAEMEAELKASEEAAQRLRTEIRKRKKAEAEAAIKAAEEARIYLNSLEPAEEASADEVEERVETTTTTTTHSDGTTEQKKEEKRYTQSDLRDSDGNTRNFGGIEFGIGVAFASDMGSNDRVKDAVLVGDGNGGQIVRVTDRENVSARLILESHYLFTPFQGFLNGIMESVFHLGNKLPHETIDGNGERKWGYGPFIAVQPGEDEIISAIGAGLMFGFRRPGEKSASFNLGIGILYDLNVRLFGEGISANQPLPPGETEIRYREEAQSGLLVMTSYSF